jgi:uncharacterized protein YndB with AHSA1/START domain
MKTKTLHQTVTFKASPKQVYEMLMDSRKHRSLSGMPAKISRRVGGKFTAWGTHISGFNLALLSGSKIVQAWRATGWWPDHYSIAIFDIRKVPSGSRLEFTQIGVPPNRYSGHYRGWIEAYWTPMKEIFERGRISEKTRRSVRKVEISESKRESFGEKYLRRCKLTVSFGRKRTRRAEFAMSALPPKADIAGRQFDVRFVPNADIAPLHSITSSALAKRDCGTLRPSVLAILRLIAS